MEKGSAATYFNLMKLEKEKKIQSHPAIEFWYFMKKNEYKAIRSKVHFCCLKKYFK